MSIEVERKKTALREEYSFFADPQELFEYLISKNKNKEGIADEFKIDEFLVKGCVSNLWVIPSYNDTDNTCHFKSDADSVITRGIADLVCGVYDGLSPQEVLNFNPSFFDEIGISAQLSPNRRNGLSKLCARIEDFAKFHLK